MPKYLKLGEKAHTFYDPSTGVHLNNKQVIRLKNPADLKIKTIAEAIRTGHLELSTEEEWKEYKRVHEHEVVESQKNLKTITKTITTTHGTNAPTTKQEFSDETADEDTDGGEDETMPEIEFADDDAELSKSDLIDNIKEHGNLSKSEKKALLTKSAGELKELWDNIKSD